MPGVPSGRACEACRQQRKKCDQTLPQCSRCRRLRIHCVGAGQQRYKFMNRSVASPASYDQETKEIRYPPSNNVTMLESRFMAVLQASDPRFDITIYGPFFKEIPKRLGLNRALDAAVSAFVTTFPSVHTRFHSPEMFSSCGEAVRSLRVSLAEDEKASQSETLCAVYLTMICQGWLQKQGESSPEHIWAMAQLLQTATSRQWQGTFEQEMLTTISFLVVIGSFISPRLELDTLTLNALPEHFGPCSPDEAASTVESLKLRNMTRLAVLVHDFDKHVPELLAAYQLLLHDCRKMRMALSKVPHVTSEHGVEVAQLLPSAKRVHVRYQSAYSTLLLVTILFHAKLAAHQSSRYPVEEDTAFLTTEVIVVADRSLQYRPLGSSSVPLCLTAGWALAEDLHTRSEIEKRLNSWQTDFQGAKWSQFAVWLRKAMNERGWFQISVEEKETMGICL